MIRFADSAASRAFKQVLVERGQLLAAAVQRELGVAPLDRVVAEHRQRLRHAADLVVARDVRNLPAELAGREALHQVGHAAERARQEMQRGEQAAEQRDGQRGDGVEDLLQVALFRHHHHVARQAHHDPGDLFAVDQDLGLALDMRTVGDAVRHRDELRAVGLPDDRALEALDDLQGFELRAGVVLVELPDRAGDRAGIEIGKILRGGAQFAHPLDAEPLHLVGDECAQDRQHRHRQRNDDLDLQPKSRKTQRHAGVLTSSWLTTP